MPANKIEYGPPLPSQWDINTAVLMMPSDNEMEVKRESGKPV